MEKYKKIFLIMIVLCFSAVCFAPGKAALPKYENAVINVLKRGPDGDMPLELTEQENAELYAILGDIKGIYLPKLFAEYNYHGRTGYEISIDSEKAGDTSDVRFHIMIGLKGQPEHANFYYAGKDSFRSIVNPNDLTEYLKKL